MITVLVECKKHRKLLADYELDPDEQKHTIRVDACEDCLDAAESEGKDSRDEEIEALNSKISELEDQIEDMQDELEN